MSGQSNTALRAAALALLLALVIVACNLAVGTAPTATSATTATTAPTQTSVVHAATLPPVTLTATPPPPSPTPTDTEVPPPEPLLHLVYVDGGDAWYSDGLGSVRRLTDMGSVNRALVTEDGLRVALLLRDPESNTAELQVIRTDGTGLATLLRPADFDRLHPLGEALHITPSQLGLIPGSHTLLFNNRAVFEGPGLAKFDDLFSLDLDSGELTPLLPPGSGGDFWFSPDGRRLALVRPDSLGMVRTDGSDPQLQALRYPPVITYSEYSFYPIPVWSPDSSLVQVVIPSQDPFAAHPGGKVWRVLVAGGPPQVLREFEGDFFRPQGPAPLLSPNLAWLAFRRAGASFGESRLVLASLLDGGESVYDRGSIQWGGWGPDSAHFIYTKDGGTALQLGALGAEPQPLAEGIGLRWLDADRFLYLRGTPGDYAIVLQQLEGSPLPLAFPAGNTVTFDVTVPSP